MESFVLKGKAETVFRLIELMAKGEKVEQTEKKQAKKGHKFLRWVIPGITRAQCSYDFGKGRWCRRGVEVHSSACQE